MVLGGERSLSHAVAAEGTAKELTFSVLIYCIHEDKNKRADVSKDSP
jgi:hypothetical protein